MTRLEVVLECAKNEEFVAGFDKLFGCSLSKLHKRSLIESLIDEASGYLNEQLAKFIFFVEETVLSRI